MLYQIKFGFLAFTMEGLHRVYPLGFYINSGWVVLFYQPFVLLAFHFIYRYLVLAR